MTSETFNFGLELQIKLLALMIRDKDFLSKNQHYIKPYYFESEVLVDISRIVLQYYKKYKNAIAFPALLTELRSFLDDSRKTDIDKYFEVLRKLFPQQIPEKQYIVDKTADFVLSQEYKKTIGDSIDLLQKGDLEGIKQLFSKTSKITFNKSKGMLYFDPDEIKDRFTDSKQQMVPTGIVGLDDALDGGNGRGELGIIMAPPNVGKSILLNVIGGGGLKLRQKVAHFSYEMRKKRVGMRYDRHILGKSFTAIKDSKEQSESFLVQFAKNLKCNLYIKDWPTRTGTVGDLIAEIEYLISEGFEPDLVLVDYAAIMKPSTKRDARHHEIEEINEELRGLAGEYNVAVWTAAQTTREALGKAVIDLNDLGECFAQSKVADVVIAACQTEKEYKENVIRLFVAKNRDGQKHQMLRYRIDYPTVRLTYAPQ